MATTVRSFSQNTAGSGTAITVSAPAGTVTGDVVFVIVTINGVTTLVDNNGGTPFTENLNDEQEATAGNTMSVFSRRIVGGDPSTYAFTGGASGRWTATAVTLQNPHASTIFNVTPAVGNKNSTSTPASPTITTTTNNALHFAIVGSDGTSNTVVSGPATYTVVTSGGQQAQSLYYKVIATAGATGDQTTVWTTIDLMIPISFAIEDNPGGGGGGATFNPNLLLLGVG